MRAIKKTIDIYEVYWDDLTDRLSKRSERYKFFSGIRLIFYWIAISIRVAKLSFSFFFESSILMLLILLWYLGIVLIAFEAISKNPSFLGFIDIPAHLAEYLGALSKNLQAWNVWIIVSGILALLPISVDKLVDLVDFSRRYSNNEKNKENESYRGLLRNRLRSIVDDVVQDGSYSRITILAHSFGVLIATDFLGDYRPSNKTQGINLRYITWGGFMATSTSSKWLSADVEKCLNSPYVDVWHEFYSKQDWLSGSVYNSKAPKFISTNIKFDISFLSRALGLSHMQYYSDSRLLRYLILDTKYID